MTYYSSRSHPPLIQVISLFLLLVVVTLMQEVSLLLVVMESSCCSCFRAGKAHGYLPVDYPNHQNYQSNHNGSNQPLMDNIASSLDDQAKMDSGLSQCMFSADQQRYILTFLLFNHKNVYLLLLLFLFLLLLLFLFLLLLLYLLLLLFLQSNTRYLILDLKE